MAGSKSDGRTSLSMLVLMAIDQMQSATVYSLYRKLGLSLGSTAPALARMEKEGLVSGVTAGARGKTSFSLTPKARHMLLENWKESLSDPLVSLEDVLRGVALAFALGGNAEKELAIAFMEEASRTHNILAIRERAQADRLKKNLTTPLDLYCWMKSEATWARKQSEASALGTIAQGIKEAGLTGGRGGDSPDRISHQEVYRKNPR
jgi:DNA-binding PadR family transcriptional regulator